MDNILITGSRGQIGTDLAIALRNRFGEDRILETDILPLPDSGRNGSHALYEVLDVREKARLEDLVARYNIDTVYHLASILSATGERAPDLAWDVNLNGLKQVLDVARDRGIRVFWPSSIAVFGPATPKHNTPQSTALDPSTMYGITKVAGELLCQYYATRFGVDVRSIRFPGLISYSAPPGGGTTDYAVEIFYAALQQGRYTCFVGPETRLPMMYMPDAVRACMDVMEAEPQAIGVRTSYNVSGASFSAGELVAEIRKHLPDFTCRFEPDFRQAIADSWPEEVDDMEAKTDWGWAPSYDLAALTSDMLEKLSEKLVSTT